MFTAILNEIISGVKPDKIAAPAPQTRANGQPVKAETWNFGAPISSRGPAYAAFSFDATRHAALGYNRNVGSHAADKSSGHTPREQMQRPIKNSDQLGQSGASSAIELDDGARVAIMGGGPAGSFFGYFFLDMAERMGLDVTVDQFEPRDFSGLGPASCNMCGGIISETLVQNLAAEGINLPSTVVQRGIDSYVLHTHEGSVRID